MNCLACGPTFSKASGEHVFAAWLLEALNAKGISIGLFKHKLDGTDEVRRNEITLDSFRLKRICTDCNNGWMSRLEEKAKPLLLCLLSGRRSFKSLNEQERWIVARWAGKTAIIESHAVGAESPVDNKLLHHMRANENGSPGLFGVAGGSRNFNIVGHLQVGIIKDLIGGGIMAGNIVVIMLPQVTLTCAFPFPDMKFQCLCDPAEYFPLWPDPDLWKPMEELPPFDPNVQGNDALAAMAERIELYHPLTW